MPEHPAIPRTWLPFAAVCLAAILLIGGGCTRRLPITEVTPLKAASPADLQQLLLSREPDLGVFRLRGPFHVTERRNVDIRVSDNLSVSADLYLCETARSAPLVIVLHGLDNSKDDHAFQALHAASWGMHAMALQLPNQGPWIANGKTLARLVSAIHQNSQLVDSRIDVRKIILVGHSYGATAVASALAESTPALGAVLLDPAGIGRELPAVLKRVKVPVMVLGADEEIWATRNREYFYRFIPRNVGEVSIRDAMHGDAQFTVERTRRLIFDDPIATEEAQVTFVSAMTASAFGLAATGGIDYAWTSFSDALKKGIFFNARRK
jgi:pimeloyl-ACP methyl ester carboxylesterase